MDTTAYSVLVILDDETIRLGITRELNKCDRCAKVDSTPSVDAGLVLMENNGYDVVFCEVDFKTRLDGEDFLDTAVAAFPSTAIIMISSSFDPKQSLQLILRGAQYCLQLPLFKAHCEVVLANLNFCMQDTVANSMEKCDEQQNPQQDAVNTAHSKRADTASMAHLQDSTLATVHCID